MKLFWRGKRRNREEYFAGDEKFLSPIREAQLAESFPRADWAIYLMLMAVIAAVAWACLAHVDEITKADGKVVPDGREQVIASLEGGILRKVLVREGSLVEQGQDLIQLDPTRVEAQQNEGEAKQLALKATLARLVAESMGKPLRFPPEVLRNESMVQAEVEMYQARKQALDEGVAVNRRNLALIQRELDLSERMSARGLMSEVEVMRLRRQSNDLTLQIQERVNRFRQDATTDLTRVRTELSQIEEQMVVKQDVLKRTILQSPVRGLVKNIRIGTIGGVVPAGATILELVPLGTTTLVEAKVKPSDIGFVKPGMPAVVKLSAYDFYTYGGIAGTLQYLSPDAFSDDGKTGESSYYRALIRCDASKLKSHGKPLPVLPGMAATVEIRTGERSVMQFILKPMMKAQEAFRER
jgi:adhesin transport system membrane fusion protein